MLVFLGRRIALIGLYCLWVNLFILVQHPLVELYCLLSYRHIINKQTNTIYSQSVSLHPNIYLSFAMNQQIQTYMLIKTRERLINTKLSTTSSIKRKSIVSANPEIQQLVHKLLTISQTQEKPKSLNHCQWQKEKYHPNEFQDRLKIQNQISLKKIHNQKVRARVKPVKKRTLSVTFQSEAQEGKTYKQHYQEIKKAQQQTITQKPQESEDEHQEPYALIKDEAKEGIRYYDTLRRYGKIFNFIEDRLEIRASKRQKLYTYSQTQPTSFSNKDTIINKRHWTNQKTQQAGKNNKIYTLMSKWKQKQPIFPKEKARNKTCSNIVSKEDMEFRSIANSTIEIDSSLFNTKIKGMSNTRRYEQN